MDNLSFTILVFTYKPIMGLNDDRCVAVVSVGQCFFLEGSFKLYSLFIIEKIFIQAIHVHKPYQDEI